VPLPNKQGRRQAFQAAQEPIEEGTGVQSANVAHPVPCFAGQTATTHAHAAKSMRCCITRQSRDAASAPTCVLCRPNSHHPTGRQALPWDSAVLTNVFPPAHAAGKTRRYAPSSSEKGSSSSSIHLHTLQASSYCCSCRRSSSSNVCSSSSRTLSPPSARWMQVVKYVVMKRSSSNVCSSSSRTLSPPSA